MAGFNIGALGGGFAGVGPSNVTETRRKHRWAFESIGRGVGAFSQAELLLLQSAARPSVKFEAPEMHHNQEVARFAGKQDWEPITLTWYDSEQVPDVSRGVYQWIETVVNMRTIKVAHPRLYKRTASLVMLDGADQVSERWNLYGTWPESCNWQELDYTSTDIQTLEATMRFDRAIRDCVSPVSPQPIVPSCPV